MYDNQNIILFGSEVFGEMLRTFLGMLSNPLVKEKYMKHKVYTVYDSKAEVYMQPIYFRADGEATRAFKASIQSNGHQFANNPGDYTLFRIAEYDDDRAAFTAYEAFVNLGNGAQFKEDV